MEVDGPGFGDLLDQAEQLTSTIDVSGELPRVERNLKQLLEIGQELWTRTAHAGLGRDSTDVRASMLLGAKGLSLPKISSKLETLSVTKSLEPLEPLAETDVEGFLRNERENMILSIIEETKTDVVELNIMWLEHKWRTEGHRHICFGDGDLIECVLQVDHTKHRTAPQSSSSIDLISGSHQPAPAFSRADKMYWDSVEVEWEAQKHKILNSFAGSPQDISESTISLQTSVSEPISLNKRSAMDNVELAYAKQVYNYNEHVIQGGIKPNLAFKFSEVADVVDDRNVSNLWLMVQSMINVPVKIGDDALATRVSPVMQRGFINQARKYLEDNYIKYMKVTVFGNLQQAALGGVPGLRHLVNSFLNVRMPKDIPGLEDGKVDGHPVWATIFYCLRCGDLASALKVTQQAGPALENFRALLTEYVQEGDRRLSARNLTTIRVLYRRSIQSSSDPFKRAVFCLVGCCDVKDDHGEVADKIDDYLWFKLCQCQTEPSNEAPSGDHLAYAQFQTKLLEEYGESHFRAFQQPFLYFQVLFLTAQFEAAIEFLSRIDHLRCHAVHVALALFEAKLLALPQSMHAQILSKDTADVSPIRRLNFVRLITLYTRKFEATDPREALQYFYFLRTLRGPKNENLLMTCISELVLETREFDMLLGQMEPDGCRRPGLIDKFGGDPQKVIEAVAADSESRGMLEDAVQLYDLAKHHEKVLLLLIKMLGQVASTANAPQSRRDRLHKMAVSLAERYRAQGHSASRDTTATFFLMLDLLSFFDTYHAKKHQDALDILKKLQLVPFQSTEVEQYVVSFRDMADEIRHHLPDILLAAMSCLQALYVEAKNSPGSSRRDAGMSRSGREDKYVTYLQQQAQTLVTFGGMVPYRMPGGTVARMVQKEMLMH